MPTPDHPLGADLQFETAVPLAAAATCVVCKTPIQQTYYHVQGAVVCESCTQRIQAGQQEPPRLSLARAAVYGGGAALAGCILYALVSILTGLEIGLIAIVVGVMVGKAVRHGSNGMGGRPQQILAVLLTYFAITTSFIPVFVYNLSKNPPAAAQITENGVRTAPPQMSFGSAVVTLLLIAAAAPFLSLSEGFSALISLFIIFIGLRQAWKLTGRTDLLVMGPYDATSPQ
jgi:hypothetical protein